MPVDLNSPVGTIPNVGPQRAKLLAERGLGTLGALLNYLPFRYEDRVNFTPIAELMPGMSATVKAEVVSGNTVKFARQRGSMFVMKMRDGSGILSTRFFHGAYLQQAYTAGQTLVLHGKVEMDPFRSSRMEMINPEIERLSEKQKNGALSSDSGRIVPVYEAIGELSPRMLRRMLFWLVQNLPANFPETLPKEILQKHKFPSRREAIRAAHFPAANETLDELNAFRSPAHRRLIFEEFFYFQLQIATRRKLERQQTGIPFQVRDDRVRQAVKRILPFKPTGAQKRVLGEIAADLERPFPMNRLLEGEVGSGKTLVALEAAVIAIENGYQVALMAPTEILAAQHYLSARRNFASAGYRAELVVSGMPAGEKRAALERIQRGDANLVAGTHALIEDPVGFKKLGLVIVDEQHRFGVLQRKRLMEKGVTPHVLVMTATPIPRTLALTLYGDLDISVIDEMPPGRVPAVTRWRSEEELAGVWEFIRREVGMGRQAYIVYPVIEESKAELKAATAEYERLAKEAFPNLKLGLLHGRLRNDEKDAVMNEFRSGKTNVLVSTTVIEVGVDVPNATIMVIEHADRFGLAQLHQLRGRIGRGSHASTCILVAPKKITGPGRERLETMVATSNGFEIAEQDLRQRGPGEIFGTRQHGDLSFHVAHPLRDHQLLELARSEAMALSEDPARAEELLKIAVPLDAAWKQRHQLAAVG
jgi:ATP-dependent DNA helicase RecG